MSSEKINKKVYHITPDGKENLIEMVATPAKPGIDDFYFKVQAVFFDLLPKERRKKVVEPLYESKFNILQDALEKKKKHGSDLSPVSRTVLEYGIKELKNSLEFYEKLMDLE